MNILLIILLLYQIVTINLDMPNKYKYNNLTLDLKLIKEKIKK